MRTVTNRAWFAAIGMLAFALAPVSPGHAKEMPSAPKPGDCRPAVLRSLLSNDDSCIVGKACGRISRPWLYRGPRGRANQLRFYGARTLDRRATQELAALLLRDAVIDSAHLVPATEISCERGDSVPVYVANFSKGDSLVRAVLRFDTGQVMFFGDLTPLGAVSMGANADSLWGVLGSSLQWDAFLAGPRPPLRGTDAPALPSFGTYVYVEELPDAIRRVPPVYPYAARLDGVSGVVMVQALVGKDGTVHDAVAVDGPFTLYDSALEAVWQWTFKPARASGEPVPVWVAIPVKFTLR